MQPTVPMAAMPSPPKGPPMPPPPSFPPLPPPCSLDEIANLLSGNQLLECYKLVGLDYELLARKGTLRTTFESMFDLAIHAKAAEERDKRALEAAKQQEAAMQQAAAEAAMQQAAAEAAMQQAAAEQQAVSEASKDFEKAIAANSSTPHKSKTRREKDSAEAQQGLADLLNQRKLRKTGNDKRAKKLLKVREMATGRGKAAANVIQDALPGAQPFVFMETDNAEDVDTEAARVSDADSTTGLERLEELGSDLNRTLNNITNGNFE